jgi:sigma-B regulation protein RsbU (phosphoserine phosphatase)
VKTRGAFRLALGPRMLVVFFLVSILPMILMAVLSYNKARMMLEMNPNEVIQSLFYLTLFLLAVALSLAVTLSHVFSVSILGPVKDMERAVLRVHQDDLTASVRVTANNELGTLAESFNEMIEGLRERFRLRQSLALAMEVQQSLLPRTEPKIQGLDVAGRSIYCDETGGDYYDFLQTNGTRKGALGVAVGDVSDHGIPSALLMTTARALLRQRFSAEGSLTSIVSDVNRHLARDLEPSGRFMTLFLAEIDTEQRQISWLTAGHDAAIVYDSQLGSFHELGGKGLVLGAFEDSEYRESRRALKPGEIILIGTDGIWETHSPEGEMFGKARLKNIVRDHSRASARGITDRVIGAVEDFRRPLGKEDDVTLVVIKVEG